MKINKKILKTSFVYLLLLAVCSSTSAQNRKFRRSEIILGEYGEVTTEKITQNRDMKLYERGGNFDCRTYALSEERGQCDEIKFAEFIWRNWSKKTRAYVLYSVNTPDAGATYHYFIEPDEKGVWSIACRLARWHAIPEIGNAVIEIFRIYSVERIEDKTANGNWKLVFKDKRGAVVFDN